MWRNERMNVKMRPEISKYNSRRRLKQSAPTENKSPSLLPPTPALHVPRSPLLEAAAAVPGGPPQARTARRCRRCTARCFGGPTAVAAATTRSQAPST